MTPEIALLLMVFTSLLCLGVPVAFVLILATGVTALSLGMGGVPVTLASDMANGIDSFSLLAIPFFILAGEIMGRGGLASRLIDLANALVGRVPGGLALVNAMTCTLFGAISGSAVAAVSSIGGTLIPEMNKRGYARDFNIAVTASAATTGLLIPPSNIMIVYALAASNVSVASLFLAGVIPGVLMGLGIGATALLLSLRHGYATKSDRTQGEASVPEIGVSRAMVRAIPSLLLVVIVLGGIFGGVFTATEASAVAVLWALILSVLCYREIKPTELPGVFLSAARMTSVVLLLVACSCALSRLLTLEQVPQQASEVLLGISSNYIVLLLIINVLLLLVGIFMDMTPAVLIFTPILLPVADSLGIDPLHFGIILIANLCIGLLTPPVGTCLFVSAGVGKSDIVSVSRAMLPFYAVMIVVLLAITFVPQLSLALPGLIAE